MDHAQERLSEYLDGTLPEAERVELERHVESCLECRRVLAELSAVAARASALEDREPALDLWAGIAARLAWAPQADRATQQVIDLRARRSAPTVRRITLTLPQLAAASIALMLVSGTVVWLALGRTPGVSTAADAADHVRTVSAPAAEPSDYTTALESLESALKQNRAQLDPVTVAILEENLRAIDTAIAEARAALQQDPGNLYLNQHLENTMKKKIQVLRRATALPGARL